jgi:hypothetical protein
MYLPLRCIALPIAAGLLGVSVTGRPLTAQSCVDLGKWGVYNDVTTVSNRQVAWAMVQQLKTVSASTLQEADQTSGGASIPIEGILVGMNFSHDESGYQAFRNMTDAELRNRFASADYEAMTSHTVSGALLETIRSCMQQPGVHTSVRSQNGSNEYAVTVRYNGTPQTPIAHVTLVSSSADCTPGFLDVSPGATLSTVCTPRHPGIPSLVVVNAPGTLQPAGNDIWLLPAPPPQKIEWRRFSTEVSVEEPVTPAAVQQWCQRVCHMVLYPGGSGRVTYAPTVPGNARALHGTLVLRAVVGDNPGPSVGGDNYELAVRVNDGPSWTVRMDGVPAGAPYGLTAKTNWYDFQVSIPESAMKAVIPGSPVTVTYTFAKFNGSAETQIAVLKSSLTIRGEQPGQ